MARTVTRVEGLKELDQALGQLSKSTGRAVLRKILRRAAEPIASAAASMAPVDDGALRDSIGVGTKLTRRQSSLHRKVIRGDKPGAEMFAGAGGLPQAITQEFGTLSNTPQPFMRPAWDAHKAGALATIRDDLGAEIERAAARAARRAARKAAKG